MDFQKLSRKFEKYTLSELPVSQEDIILKEYLLKYGLAKFLTESYDYWVDYILPQQFKLRSINVPEYGKLVFTKITLDKPRLDNGEKLTPYLATDLKKTYSGKLTAEVEFQFEDPQVKPERTTINLGTIPILLGSSRCWLRDCTDEEKIQYNECPNDPLGYFLIAGKEKVTPKTVNNQQKLRQLISLCSREDKYSYPNTTTT
ncbi:MAG: hypothetical protein WBA74_02600, partial [Cyclobacteriaceae bacterium]